MPNVVRPIRSHSDYETALDRLAEILELAPAPGSAEDDELQILEMVIAKFDAEKAEKWPLTPIEAIEFRMRQSDMTKKDLVPYLGSLSRVSEVLSGKRPLTRDMMFKLHARLGIPAKSLLSPDDSDDDQDEDQEFDFDRLPLKELQERGYLGDTNVSGAILKARAAELIAPLLQRAHTIGTSSLLRAPLFQSGNRTIEDGALRAWILIVVAKARDQGVRSKYRSGSITIEWMRAVAKLSAFDQGPKLAQQYLSRSGICLVIVKHFHKTYLDGAALMDGAMPIVALTLRHDRLDNFWFALLHELSHVWKHISKKRCFIADNLDDKARNAQEQEKEADALAQEALIPSALWEASTLKDTSSLNDALSLAHEAEIHPAIVAGRVRWHTGNWRLLSNLISDAGTASQHFEGEIG